MLNNPGFPEDQSPPATVLFKPRSLGGLFPQADASSKHRTMLKILSDPYYPGPPNIDLDSLPIGQAEDILYARDMISVTELSIKCKTPRFWGGMVHQSLADGDTSYLYDLLQSKSCGHFEASMLNLALAKSHESVVSNRHYHIIHARYYLQVFKDEHKDMCNGHMIWISNTLSDMREIHDGLLRKHRAEVRFIEETLDSPEKWKQDGLIMSLDSGVK
ncbi:hypothetical protein IFR05_010685 [Cadophora sp. M221]|nr:hypothetical protein IFR05_010685 [Cadophora sp. M221]